MKISLTLLKSKKPNKKGFPIVVNLRDKNRTKRLFFQLFSLPEHWNYENNLPTKLHPSFYDTTEDILKLKAKILELDRSNESDFNKITNELKFVLDEEAQKQRTDFFAFAELLIAEMKNRNEKSNATVYNTAKIQFKKYSNEITFEEIDYNLLIGFVNRKKIQGLKSATIHNYLRTIRAIYNQAVKRKIIEDTKPFEGVFAGLKVRSHRAKKKHLLHEDIVKLEDAKLTGLKDFVRDIFLLQFYLGGQDLKDIFYLKHTDINKDRIFFERSKVVNGYEFDLAITPKIKNILSKYDEDTYLFPYRKDHQGYITFRRRYSRYLIIIQELLNIEVNPLGGNLGIKVARHSFANIGKLKGIDGDLLRELMGHERDDVDNYYKDKYPVHIRDEAQRKIINEL